MTTFYKCESCDHVSDDIDEIDIVDWANAQGPTDVYGIPSGCCTECGAPVYEEGTFAKIDAARAMLAALEAADARLAADGFDPDQSTRFEIRRAITQARDAGITPAPL